MVLVLWGVDVILGNGYGIWGQPYVALIQGSGALAGFRSGNWILGVWCFGMARGNVRWWLYSWGVRFSSSGIVFLWVGACGVVVGRVGGGGFGVGWWGRGRRPWFRGCIGAWLGWGADAGCGMGVWYYFACRIDITGLFYVL